MSKKTHPTLIGGFVVGAVSLVVAAVALFGGQQLFAERLRYVAYFDESTRGLRVGSNVTLNGVRVGYVADMALLVDQSTFSTLTLVTMEILPEALIVTDFGEVVQTVARRTPIGHNTLIEEAGLRAQLETESFVTGQLVVGLNMRPETQAIYRGVEPLHQEIPTVPSSTQALLSEIRTWLERVGDDFDLEVIAARINNILEGLDEITNSQDLRESLAGVNQFINDQQMQQLAANVNSVLSEIQVTTQSAQTLLTNADGQIEGLAADIRPALDSLVSLMEQAEQTLLAASQQLQGNSVQMYQLQDTLEEVESAALALREFFDLLERQPESLISGKD